MLKKFAAIRGVGAFQAYGPKGDVALRPFTAIWGPNSVGKSTLCDVVRSFSTGDPAPILGRRSLSGTAIPEVDLLFDAEMRTFRNGAWDAPADPQIHIFDTSYVHENVYVGDFVDHDQKKSLYRVIVGAEGVALASTVDALDEALRDATKVVSAKREAITAGLSRGVSLDQFLGIERDADIGAKIQAKQKELAALQQADAVARRPPLTAVDLPSLPKDTDVVLAKTLVGVSAEAERLVREHVSKTHLREGWLSEGLRAAHDDHCPFCDQSLTASELLQAFRGYFSEAYGELKERVAALQRAVSSAFGASVVQRFQAILARNQELGQEWQTLVGESWERTLDLGAMETARDAALAALRGKEAAPLEPLAAVLPSPAATAYDAVLAAAVAYNAALVAYNERIQVVKGQARAGQLSRAQSELEGLEAQRRRYEEPLETVCSELHRCTADRERLDREKTEAKGKLDEHAAKILAGCQVAINRFLQKFGTTFRILKFERKYAGGTPSSSYVLEINNVQVELGDRRTSRAEPSFRNTLSGGDRSALALAFFLAQMEQDVELAKKIVVLDDPFTSQDRGRRQCTQQEIRRLRVRAHQVIVLSHDEAFLAECCEGVVAADLKTLLLRRSVIGPILEEWDSTAPRGQTLRDSQRLKNFLAEGCAGGAGALRDVARTIRPLLEGYLRGRFIGQFADGLWLGDMIKILREKEAKLPERAALPDELEAINDFSKRYHHAEWESEPIDETEVQAYVVRTLALADGF
jgi:wobble nucleotide-excising tRNase